jgi:hypothetical protein
MSTDETTDRALAQIGQEVRALTARLLALTPALRGHKSLAGALYFLQQALCALEKLRLQTAPRAQKIRAAPPETPQSGLFGPE